MPSTYAHILISRPRSAQTMFIILCFFHQFIFITISIQQCSILWPRFFFLSLCFFFPSWTALWLQFQSCPLLILAMSFIKRPRLVWVSEQARSRLPSIAVPPPNIILSLPNYIYTILYNSRKPASTISPTLDMPSLRLETFDFALHFLHVTEAGL